MIARVLLDTGPLVAAINRRDRFHTWTLRWLGEIVPPLRTCEAVLAEACFLLQKYPGGSASVLELVHRGIVVVGFDLEEHVVPVSKIMDKYANVSMSLADACLVRMSELDSKCQVLTVDTDFHIYRRHGRQTIPVIIPEKK